VLSSGSRKGTGAWTSRKKGFYVRMRKRRKGLQTTFNSNDVPPLRSVPRTGCVGHCGNLRLKKGEEGKRERQCELAFSEE
jgi:hypothetical protein